MQQPDYFDKRDEAERAAYIRAQVGKATAFKYPAKVNSDEEREAAEIEANPNLDFNNILTGMGGSGFLSSGNESEEEKKEE